MSTVKTNAILDASGGETATVNGYTPTLSNMPGYNRIINGDMRIDQRNAGASFTPTSGGYGIDRFGYILSQSSKITSQRSTTAPEGFTNSLLITSSAATTVGAADYFTVQQPIEGFNVADFNWGTASAKSITVSFWVRSSLTGTFGGSVINQYNVSGRYYQFTYTISAANTWEQKSVTIPGDTSGTWLTNNGVGLHLSFSLGVGSTYSATAGSWGGTYAFSPTGATQLVATNGATWYITGVQLEVGSVATPFERRPYGLETMLCQRYYYKLASGVDGQIGSGYYYSTAQAQLWVKFAVSMRSAPVLSSVTGTNYYRTEPVGGGTDAFNSFTIYLPTTEGTLIYNNTEVSSTANYAAGFYTNNASAFVAFSSEL